ncbi:hypothetical protein WMY93_020664 [Mugilogobius chulae]|uniref:Uncharacterized protein n=1 Tax=Mugilogobius chulae TaxID=88201 RepID=A0AAW0NIJ5_9GOBI
MVVCQKVRRSQDDKETLIPPSTRHNCSRTEKNVEELDKNVQWRNIIPQNDPSQAGRNSGCSMACGVSPIDIITSQWRERQCSAPDVRLLQVTETRQAARKVDSICGCVKSDEEIAQMLGEVMSPE